MLGIKQVEQGQNLEFLFYLQTLEKLENTQVVLEMILKLYLLRENKTL